VPAGAGFFAQALAFLGRPVVRAGVAAARRRRLGPQGGVLVARVLLGCHGADRGGPVPRAVVVLSPRSAGVLRGPALTNLTLTAL
jgi:hypothetical protein